MSVQMFRPIWLIIQLYFASTKLRGCHLAVVEIIKEQWDIFLNVTK